VVRVEVWDNGEQLLVINKAVETLTLTNLVTGEHEIKVVAYGTFGISGESDAIAVSVLPVETQVEFLGVDSGTQGNWEGRYGRKGWWFAGMDPELPSSIELLPANTSFWSFAESTDDPSALQRPGGDDRFAACVFGQEFTVDLNLRDGQPSTVALYVLDWGDSHRAMELSVEKIDGTVLDRHDVNSFSSGRYYFWRIQGQARFRFLSRAINAVLTGLFVDPPLTPYELWLNSQFSAAELQAGVNSLSASDSDGDGFSNALEYFLGFNPKSSEDKPKFSYTASTGWFQISLSQRTEAPGMQLSFEISEDLVHWEQVTPVKIVQKTADGSRISFNFPVSPGANRWFVRYSLVALKFLF